jgi:hypothetical protein
MARRSKGWKDVMVIVICTPLNIRNILFPASGSPRLVDAPEGGRQKEIGGIFNFSVTSGKRCEEFSISFFGRLGCALWYEKNAPPFMIPAGIGMSLTDSP